MLLFVERDVALKTRTPAAVHHAPSLTPHSVNRVETQVLSNKNGGRGSIFPKYAKLRACERPAAARGLAARVSKREARAWEPRKPATRGLASRPQVLNPSTQQPARARSVLNAPDRQLAPRGSALNPPDPQPAPWRSVLSPSDPLLATRRSVLGPSDPLLATRCSVLNPPDPLLASWRSVLNRPDPLLATWRSVLNPPASALARRRSVESPGLTTCVVALCTELAASPRGETAGSDSLSPPASLDACHTFFASVARTWSSRSSSGASTPPT